MRAKMKAKLNQIPKNVLEGEDFKKLQKCAKKLGAKSLDYSKTKNSKYFIELDDGKNVHFGNPCYQDYLIHGDEERRTKYLARARNIKNKSGELTYNNPESPMELLVNQSFMIRKN